MKNLDNLKPGTRITYKGAAGVVLSIGENKTLAGHHVKIQLDTERIPRTVQPKDLKREKVDKTDV